MYHILRVCILHTIYYVCTTVYHSSVVVLLHIDTTHMYHILLVIHKMCSMCVHVPYSVCCMYVYGVCVHICVVCPTIRYIGIFHNPLHMIMYIHLLIYGRSLGDGLARWLGVALAEAQRRPPKAGSRACAYVGLR